MSTTAVEHEPKTQSKKILLVDDDPSGVEIVLYALNQLSLGGSVQTVEDGEAALDYIYRRNAFADRTPVNPAVILLDLKMPKVSGLDVLRIIKADRNVSSIPVVVLTSSREESDVASSYTLGVNAYVVKPVDYTELLGTVKELGAFWTRLNEPPPGSAV